MTPGHIQLKVLVGLGCADAADGFASAIDDIVFLKLECFRVTVDLNKIIFAEGHPIGVFGR